TNRRHHTRLQGDWSSDVCSSDLVSRGCGQRRGVFCVAISAESSIPGSERSVDCDKWQFVAIRREVQTRHVYRWTNSPWRGESVQIGRESCRERFMMWFTRSCMVD